MAILQWLIGLRKYRRSKRKEESDGYSLQTSKAAANGTAPQKPELHRTIEEAADGEAEEILYPISFQQRCKRTSSGCLIEIETDAPIYARMRASLAELDQDEFTEGHELDRNWQHRRR
jgi:hypothetical protein